MPIEEQAFYKASEWRIFTLFFSPIVYATIQNRHVYKHWMRYTFAMDLLSQKEISRQDFETARLLIFKFIEDFSSIYGEENVCYNLQMLIHHGKLYGTQAYSNELKRDNSVVL